MGFTLSAEQNMIADTARRMGEQFGLEYWREIDHTSEEMILNYIAVHDLGMVRGY